jgi:hypothetical protein
MQKTGHWPFGGDAGATGDHGSQSFRKEEDERARAAEQAALRQHMRHDRLIVGGRAHTKKRGLN